MDNRFWMEDVGGLTVKAIDTIQDGLREFDLQLTDAEEDKVFDHIWKALEDKSNGNYRKEM